MDLDTLIIGAIIGALVTLPIAIFGNLLSDWFRTIKDKSIFSSKQRKIKSILEEYRSIKEMSVDSSKILVFYLKQILLFAKMILSGVIICLLLVLIDFPTEVYPILYFMSALYVIIVCAGSLRVSSQLKTLNYISSPVEFVLYMFGTSQKLELLGGDTNELKKINTEVASSEEIELKQWGQISYVMDFVKNLRDSKETQTLDARIQEAREYVSQWETVIKVLLKLNQAFKMGNLSKMKKEIKRIRGDFDNLDTLPEEISKRKASIAMLNDKKILDLVMELVLLTNPTSARMFELAYDVEIEGTFDVEVDELNKFSEIIRNADNLMTRIKIRLDELSKTID